MLFVAAFSSSIAAEERLPVLSGKAFAAEVGRGRVTVDEIFEIWGPAWYETIAETRSGQLSPEKCDRKLQNEWREALDTVIREEALYQEAQTQHEKHLKDAIDKIYRSQSQRKDGPSRQQVAKEVNHQAQKQIARALDRMVERFIKAAGGLLQLKRVLKNRNLTYEEWKYRLQKKAFTGHYLELLLRPKVGMNPRPREILDYYKGNEKAFIKKGNVTFRHIFFSHEKRGGEVASRLAAVNLYEAIMAKKISFEAAARKHSDDPVSQEKGGLETKPAIEADREIWLHDVREAARQEKPGILGPILISPFGSHLITLIGVGKDIPISFRYVQKSISVKIQSERWEQAISDLYIELKRDAHLQILLPTFPAELSWKQVQAYESSNPPTYHIGVGARPGPDSLPLQ